MSSKSISAVHHLFAYNDGDTITPRMGVQIDAGYGLTQYWNPVEQKVENTDFTKHPAILYPLPYSSRRGKYVVPAKAGQQWYYNNPDSESAAILDGNGNVKEQFENLFEVVAAGVTFNGMVFPALKIMGNLVSADDLTDKYIYYSGTFEGKAFTCQQCITVQATVENAIDILIQSTGPDGISDDVLSNDTDFVILTPYLQRAGAPIGSGVTFAWQKLVNGLWTAVANVSGYTEINSSTGALTVYESAVDGEEMYRCTATYNGKAYYKIKAVTDIHDPYYIDPNCSIPGESIKPNETAVYSPKVYNRAKGTEDTEFTWTFDFDVVKSSDGATVDVSKTATTCSVTYDQVLEGKGVAVRIEATAS